MKRFPIPRSLGPLLFLMAECAAAGPSLTVHANEASVQLQPRDETLQQVRLPALDLSLTASFSCEPNSEAESLTVSVLDTHRRYGQDDLSSTASIDVVLSVPATQFAPISVPDFCVGDADAADTSLLIPGVASAQVSLRCRSDSGSPSVHFASATLPLRLGCSPNNAQDSSADR